MDGQRNTGSPKLRYRDRIGRLLEQYNIRRNDLEEIAAGRQLWMRTYQSTSARTVWIGTGKMWAFKE